MSKEKIVEEFDKIIGEAPELVRLSKVSGENVCFICGQPFNKSEQVKQLKQFLSKAIAQTREETIRKVEAEMKNIYNDEEGRGNWEYTIGYKERNNEVLDILNKLKK